MEKINQIYPGKSSKVIYERFKDQIWKRRKEISSFKQLELFMESAKWDDDDYSVKTETRIFMMKFSISAEIIDNKLTVRIVIPLKKYEIKYAARVKKILETLFDKEKDLTKKKVSKSTSKKTVKKKAAKKKITKKKTTKKKI